MKKVFLLVFLFAGLQVGAQIKNIAGLVSICKSSRNALAASLGKSYWKLDQEGKMDTLNYVRWIPKNITPANGGEMIMGFYKTKDKPVDYIVFQTIDSKRKDAAMKELASLNYKSIEAKDTKDGKREIYSNGTYEVTVTIGHPDPKAAPIYLFGARPVPPAKPAAKKK